MKRKRNSSWLQRLFCLLMAIHVLNFSVNPPDQHVYRTTSGVIREDLSVNEMESIGEWILEHIFGIDVAEQNEPDDDDGVARRLVKLALPLPLPFRLSCPAFISVRVTVAAIPFISLPYISQIKEIHSPPPQFL